MIEGKKAQDQEDTRLRVDVVNRLGRSCSWDSSVPLSAHHTHKAGGGLHWSVTDTLDSKVRLPLASFNHIAREVLSLERSKTFYVDVLGFDVGPRPPFDSDGYWLYGYGLSLHLVLTTQPVARKLLKKDRIKYFTTCLPRVDHIAFITSDISIIRRTLDERCVYYKYDCPANTGIEQVFFFDPDGNVIEVSNCAVREQGCGAEVVGVNAAPSPLLPLQLVGIPLRAQRSPISAIVRSPSQVYINGSNVIVSPVHLDEASLASPAVPEEGSTSRIPAEMQSAIDKALLAAAGLPSMLQFTSSRDTEAGDDCGEGVYIFDESFDFDEAESNRAVTVTAGEAEEDGEQEEEEDDDPGDFLLLESLGLEVGR